MPTTTFMIHEHEHLSPGKRMANSNPESLMFWWLGQAGFWLRWGNLDILIDPYLSDSLAKKYRGTRFPHVRMMDAPVSPDLLKNIDWVFASHGHTDHMDPETLGPIVKNNPTCHLVAPRAERREGLQRGLPDSRTSWVTAQDSLELAQGARLEILPSAHESLKTNVNGEHHFIGFLIRLGDLTIYHSGDCCPFDSLPQLLAASKIDLALLPVNGRDKNRTNNGIFGNFNFEEAVGLCIDAQIPLMIGHHFGMFEFNTVDLEQLNAQCAKQTDHPHCLAARINVGYEILGSK